MDARSDKNAAPLAVDLDGTLIAGDLLWEGLFLLIRKNMLPGASPSTRRKIAATTSSEPPTRSAILSKGTKLTVGTDMSTGLSRSLDNAVAACPAPMFPTSRRTSILKSGL